MTTIKLKNGSGAPLAGDLVQGEPALDLTNKRLYTENSSGTVIEVGTNPGEDVTFADNRKALFGAGSDLQIYHDGSNSYIRENGTGLLYIGATDKLLIQDSTLTNTSAKFDTNADVSLYYNNAKKLETTSTGIDVTGVITTDGMTTSADINFGDNDKAVFGAGSDLQIFHDGSNSYIQENGTGDLLVGATNFQLKSGDYGESMLTATDDGAVTLFYNNASKIATTNTGIDVTGVITTDGGTFDGSLLMYLSNELQFFNSNYGIKASTGLEIKTGDFTRFLIGSTEHMRIASGGDVIFYNSGGSSQDFYWDSSTSRLGLGTTSPVSILEIKDANSQLTIDSTLSQFSRVVHQHNGTSMWTTGTRSASDYHIFRESGTGNVIIDAGDLHISELGSKFTLGPTLNASVHSGAGIKASTPRLTFEPTADAQSSRIQFANTAGTMWGAIFGYNNTETIQHSATTHTFLTSSSERMRIDASGNLLVGTTNASGTAGSGIKLTNPTSPADDGKLMIVGATSTSGQDALQVYSTGASAYRFFVNYAGSVYATSTSITAISDQSLKENVRDLDKGLDTVLALQPRRFDWKNGDGNDIMGFVAQEVEEVMPELVHDFQYTATETKLGLKMGDMVPTLVKAIQDQQEIIDNLKSRIEQLEGAN